MVCGILGCVTNQPLALRAADTTADNPWPLRKLTENIKTYVERMSTLWVEGQIVEYKPRATSKIAFFVLRDVETDTSMTVTAWPGMVKELGGAFTEGARIVTRVTPQFWTSKGSLNLRAQEIRIAGSGNLLLQIEQLRAQLQKEGLFALERKKPIPFLPGRIGLICGSNAKAKDDVLVNATDRWPVADFEIREVAVQGERCVPEVMSALSELDARPDIDVIVIARGGGSVEDLLPFSNERLLRAVALASTPIVSAIGHEADAPLLDFVADFRASTPTDAAKRIVPDYATEQAHIQTAIDTMRGAIMLRLGRERQFIDSYASRPVLLSPGAVVDTHRAGLAQALTGLRHAVERRLSAETTALGRMQATLTALSPQGTLDRGYSILKLPSGVIIKNVADAPKGSLIEGILASGRMVAQVVGTTPAPPADQANG